MSNRILIVDDDESLREKVDVLLSAENCEVFGVTSGRAALYLVENSPIDVILSNSRARGIDGMELLPQLSIRMPGTPIILLCERDDPDPASEAVKRGAYDYLVKPLDPSQAVLTLRRAQERVRLAREHQLARRDLQRATGDPPIVATSTDMIELLEVMERAAPYKSTILLSGERGSGREALARAIHAQSPRRDQAFVSVDCGRSLHPEFAVEVFGEAGPTQSGARLARRGLLVEANGGTLFLNEVGELPASHQAKLLGVLQDEALEIAGDSKPIPIDVRVVAGSSHDLAAEVASGSFLEDLFHRLNGVQLEVPPLRERPRDIPLLFDHFRAHFCDVLDKASHGITDDGLACLVEHSWPGNIRELANVVERAVLMATGNHITVADLPEDISVPAPDAAKTDRTRDLSLKTARKSFEADMIRRALRATHGNRTHAARRLGISHRGLLYKIKEYQIRD